ncbi:hypothetical protein D3C77_530230 [compost metagenome]
MRGSETNTRNVDLADIIHQIGKRVIHVREILAVCVDVLSQQRNFLEALPCQVANLGNDILWKAAALLAAGKRYDAIGAKFVAAVHNVNPSAHAFPLLR